MSLKVLVVEVMIYGQEITGGDSDVKKTHLLNYKREFGEGTANGLLNRVWSDQNRLLAATSEELDMVGTLTDAGGVAINNDKVNIVAVHNNNTTVAEHLLLGGGSASQFAALFGDPADKLVIPNDALFLIVAPREGFASVGGASDKLKVDAQTFNITYDVLVAGRDT